MTKPKSEEMKIRIERKWQDVWIGAFWKIDAPRAVCHCGDWMDTHSSTTHFAVEMRQAHILHVWICLVPCFPIHIEKEI